MPEPLATEKHFTRTELGTLWNLSQSMVRKIFADEPGVVKIGEPSRREGKRLVRAYLTMHIPESVVLRVHARLTGSGKKRPIG